MDNTDKQRQNREANLKPFKPGQSGNPAGRPRGTEQLKKMLEKFLRGHPVKDGKPLDQTKLDLLMEALFRQALTKPEAMKLILAYLYGQPRAEVDLTSNNDPLTIRPIIRVIDSQTEELVTKIRNGGRG